MLIGERIANLKSWIERDIPKSKVHYDLDYGVVGGDEHFKIYLYTESNKYAIYAREYTNNDYDYLGCMCQSRRQRPGEDWFRGRDLPDGRITEKTWREILMAILRTEFQDVVKVDQRKNHADIFGPAPEPTES